MTSIKRRDQTPFLKRAWSLEPFGYAGDCAALSGINMSVGATGFGAPIRKQDASGGVYAVAPPDSGQGTLRLKKSIAQLLSAEEWLGGRWHIDVRHQVGGTRSGALNWDLIERYLLARFSRYVSDDETTFSLDGNDIVLAAMQFECAPKQVVRLHRLAAISTFNAPAEVLCLAKVNNPLTPKASRIAEGYGVIAGTATGVAHPYFGRSADGGETWIWVRFNGLYNTPDWSNAITGIAGEGEFFVVVSHGEAKHAYTLDAGQTWTEVEFDQYSSHAPRDVVMYNPWTMWICGDDGYVWFTRDAIHEQIVHAGTQVREDLYRVYALTDRQVLIVGEANSLLKFENKRWVAVSGPVPQAGANALCAAVAAPDLWGIGYSDGDLYWTADGGDTWTQDVVIANRGWLEVSDIASVPALRWLTLGRIPSYMVFNGTNSLVNCGSDASIDNLPSTTDFTLEAWIAPDSAGEGTFGTTFRKGSWYVRMIGPNDIQAWATFDVTSANSRVAFPYDGGWHHIAAVWDSGTNTFSFYIDGIEPAYVTQIAGANNYVSDAANSGIIGNNSGAAWTFDGNIQWLRVSSNQRYAANFTPPDRCKIPADDANTVSLWIVDDPDALVEDLYGPNDGVPTALGEGYDCGDLAEENVHEAPSMWESLTVPAALTRARAVVSCDENRFVVAGRRAGGGFVTVLSKA